MLQVFGTQDRDDAIRVLDRPLAFFKASANGVINAFVFPDKGIGKTAIINRIGKNLGQGHAKLLKSSGSSGQVPTF